MMHAGLDLSRQRLEQLLSDQGERVEHLAVVPTADGLRDLVGRVARYGQPVQAAIESMTGPGLSTTSWSSPAGKWLSLMRSK